MNPWSYIVFGMKFPASFLRTLERVTLIVLSETSGRWCPPQTFDMSFSLVSIFF